MDSGIKSYGRLPALAEGGAAVLAVVETPQGSRNKFDYDEELGVFRFKAVLPEGVAFPYDFGFVPSTRGGDGDPLDILVLMDAPAFPGCVITARLIGAIEAEQNEKNGKGERNDRLVGVATLARTHQHVRSLDDLRPGMIGEIEAFFEHYNRLSGKEFHPLRRSTPDEALHIVRQAIEAFEAGRSG